jgi:RNA polymerase sigma factor (sigma-70 family)
VEASVLSQPAKMTAIGVRAPFLRLQPDDKLIALVRAGDQAAFEALVQRYRSRLFAFCRHMLHSREDAEDVLQEVFANSYRAIVADERKIFVRPWLYRIARNMCLKHLGKRRPAADGGVEEMDIAAYSTTVDAVHMREDLRHVVVDVQELPETQRTALLMREIDGLSYDQIATAMDTSVAGVKSLLVRARVSLAEAAEGRLLSCEVVHLELRQASEGLARVSGPARRHARHCELCGSYQSKLGLGRSRAAAAAAFLPLAPVSLIKAIAARLGAGAAGGTGAGLAGGGSAAGTGAAAAGGAAGAAGGTAGGAVTATLGAVGAKAAVAVATATLVAAGAADIHKAATHHRHHAHPAAAVAPASPAPVALSAGSQQHTAPIVQQTTSPPAASKHSHQHRASTQTGSGNGGAGNSSSTGSSALPATQGGGSGAFADPPPPPSSTETPAGHDPPPTDPASQPIGAKEPVQVQGFDPGSNPSGGTSTGP